MDEIKQELLDDSKKHLASVDKLLKVSGCGIWVAFCAGIASFWYPPMLLLTWASVLGYFVFLSPRVEKNFRKIKYNLGFLDGMDFAQENKS